MRAYDTMGFSGFESRYYSLFPSFSQDMAKALELQNFLHALAFKYMAEGIADHHHIPDDPFVESERRQITFGCAIGIPTFYIRRDTKNEFLKRILAECRRIRQSRRYPGYFRVYHIEYCRALLKIIRRDGADLIELFQMEETIDDLTRRIDDPAQAGAFGKLKQGILNKSGMSSPLSLKGDTVNREAENYYRNDLRKDHFHEAWLFFQQDLSKLLKLPNRHGEEARQAFKMMQKDKSVPEYLPMLEKEIFGETVSPNLLKSIIHLLILTICEDKEKSHLLTDDSAKQETDPQIKPGQNMKASLCQ
jgi:hypothetical protein